MARSGGLYAWSSPENGGTPEERTEKRHLLVPILGMIFAVVVFGGIAVALIAEDGLNAVHAVVLFGLIIAAAFFIGLAVANRKGG